VALVGTGASGLASAGGSRQQAEKWAANKYFKLNKLIFCRQKGIEY
jgi:hypothetical protein